MSASSLSAYDRGRQRAALLLPQTNAERYWRDSARCLADALGWPRQQLIERVTAFHAERLDAVPSLTRYPELRAYRADLLEEYRGVADAGVDPVVLALSVSLNFWRDTRLLQETGKAVRVATLPERCRVLYTPESDRGPLHAKNVDNPLTYWQPRARYAPNSPWPHPHPLFFDGVGSGLHIDEIPPEIFPVNVVELCRAHCTTVDAATEFLQRYNYFWSSQNLLVHDHDGNSMAFEKTRCRIATRPANSDGVNFVNGMGALDPALAAFQKQQRQKYLDQIGASWDSPDGCFWKVCEGKWRNMSRYVSALNNPTSFAEVNALMEQRDPAGPMCLTGQKSHPDQEVAGCTLVMDVWLLEPRKLHRRQWRGTTPAYLDTPEIVDFAE